MDIEQLATDAGLSAPHRYVVDWGRAEAELGTRLPADYKEYVYWFGPGCFEYYLFICVPGVENSVQELAARLAREQAGERLLVEDLKAPPLVPLFPETAGWLPWGHTTGGDALYWVTSSDDPDRWTIAGRPGRGRDYAYFDGSFTEFLHTYVWDTVEMHFLSEAEKDIPIAFQPDHGAWPGEPAGRLEPYGCFETDR
ncbi:SMI1/KNR4 family protein [Streptomyces sp. C10-9-1]|uniref:SMI1/KNR4 family protein n=1 Tax=Streptomyces sp. C10-9-1 TaxID=1859285 RepID=UPI003D7055FA